MCDSNVKSKPAPGDIVLAGKWPHPSSRVFKVRKKEGGWEHARNRAEAWKIRCQILGEPLEWYDDNGYLTPLHPRRFERIEHREPTSYATEECPYCKGHGYINLRLDCYRGDYPHFRGQCPQCGGWGYLPAGDTGLTCVPHAWKELSYDECLRRDINHMGRCWHVYECSKCGKLSAADSSD